MQSAGGRWQNDTDDPQSREPVAGWRHGQGKAVGKPLLMFCKTLSQMRTGKSGVMLFYLVPDKL
ncbi:hypothetical protein [Tatumella sp. JGM118]|uniref:Uncharacterized protein n=1 Tax=Tatumella terrea TaxID=419007 RepID=A0ABW1W344_9GAMM|nr:hypothetical protein [Tatumella sp. JGM118]MBS0908902.1 hypothetical protein [Tatumella sp. JGM118]